MSESVVRVSGLSKKYIISHQQRAGYATLRETLTNSATQFGWRLLHALKSSAQPYSDPRHEEIWALNDISFEVKRGERFGIIGRNGAGKSTLLKILSRITEPTLGKVTLCGRVASLLEVGTGFHPELTGRENIYLNGAILGMGKAEMKARFDEIVAFSEVEKFLDTPLKRYSSGMQVRLAFAVAAHLDPEILVVDEVLAVGDFAFQKKCLGKMQDVARGGRTVLFVSHDMGAINTLCQRALLLNSGEITMIGLTKDVVERYLEVGGGLYTPIRIPVQDHGEFRLISVTATQNGRATDVVRSRQPFTVTIEYENVEVVRGSRLMLILRNQKGEVVFTTSDYDEPSEEAYSRQVGRFVSCVTVPGKLLKEGVVYGTVAVDVRSERIVFAEPDVLQVDVVDPESDPFSETHRRDGVIAPILPWSMIRVTNAGNSKDPAWQDNAAQSQGRIQD
jgi:lipopolysaccharide transport system ATP-binding protein